MTSQNTVEMKRQMKTSSRIRANSGTLVAQQALKNGNSGALEVSLEVTRRCKAESVDSGSGTIFFSVEV